MNFEERLKEVRLIVKATPYEVFQLWVENKTLNRSWEQLPGNIEQIGYISCLNKPTDSFYSNLPLQIQCLFEKIDGNVVLFWSFYSRMADTYLVDRYLDAKLPGIEKTDAFNFWARSQNIK
jgi:hypothetical protein